MIRSRTIRQAGLAEKSAPRRGTMFNYYMVYLLLTGIMLSSAGISLHVVLRSGARDEAASSRIRTVVRLERQLRDDERSAANSRIDNRGLTFVLSNGEQIVWSSDRHTIHRQRLLAGETRARDRFVLSRTSEVRFERLDDRIAVVRILESVVPNATTVESGESGSAADAQTPAFPTAAIDILVAAESIGEGT